MDKVKLRTCLRSPEQQGQKGQMNELQTGVQQALAVLGQPPVLVQPGKAGLDDPARGHQQGEVEVDESLPGAHRPRAPDPCSRPPEPHGPGAGGHRSGNPQLKGLGRIRVQQIERSNEASLMPFIQASIRPGARIHSDGSAAYRHLAENGSPTAKPSI
jgi:hypothetical protein